MRLMDIMLAIPGLLLAIGIVAMLGPGLFQIMIAVGVTSIPIFARLMRGSILSQRENDFVLAARSVGVPRRSILGSHILPNAISPVIVQATLALATAIIDVAGLAFLGLGDPDPSRPEWGRDADAEHERVPPVRAPFLAIIPGIAIVISALGRQRDRRRAARGARPEAAGAGVTEPLLAVEGLDVRFWTTRGTVHAVDGVSLRRSHRGETLGIVGESGCGKSVHRAGDPRAPAARAGRVTGRQRAASRAATCSALPTASCAASAAARSR